MKLYLIFTGISFALIALAHFARLYVEGASVLRYPIFVFTTILSIAISIWAAFLLKRSMRKNKV